MIRSRTVWLRDPFLPEETAAKPRLQLGIIATASRPFLPTASQGFVKVHGVHLASETQLDQRLLRTIEILPGGKDFEVAVQAFLETRIGK